jgi:site-specific recombinase XerC
VCGLVGAADDASERAQPKLAGHTLAYYARAWDLHVLPRLGELELRRLTPAVITGFADELRRDGAGDPTVRKALSLLQGVLTHAVVLGKLQANPSPRKNSSAQHVRRARRVRPQRESVSQTQTKNHAERLLHKASAGLLVRRVIGDRA